ncbi:MAG: 3-oxoacyl-[acyl-carrier-protein] synthase III C-terminal domain-containing protein [Acidobacteriota bacterium]|nr:MAG: 3-oxoacyl-[acyl-carrier-protein] synthase III C-terminal domain-containing protein [Acidobacteriota bacterium]
MRIASVGTAFPKNYYSQEALSANLKQFWAKRHHNLERLDQLHQNVLVGGRHLALPIEEYLKLDSFSDSNDAFIRVAVDVGAEAIQNTLEPLGMTLRDVDHVFFVSTTGIATPSIDARIFNRLGVRSDIKRTPVFGLGCVAGAVGITRAADYVRAFPDQTALVLSVELCSLTLQRKDLSIPNIIASGLFGDAAAAALVVGAECEPSGPSVVATRSIFYPDTEYIMGWDIKQEGFQVVLSAELPNLVKGIVRENVDNFLEAHGLTLSDIETFVCHPGGPKVLEAFQKALEIEDDGLSITWDSLKRVGNVSSASVLTVLGDTLRSRSPTPGSYGILMAMGPGFCTELVLLRW